ncbi:unnamed protein product [Mytilus edulis]|uniref:Uncharacterized protein n=1 Tax=Mytilus edulis TaxID=6550 RepID=A0A8S3S5P9_MYTED|nr:unnamed protein product [Mytilus edulis]
MFDSGFLRNPNGISFSMNTDGVPVFKSSRISMWPVYMLINELPIGERKLKENIVYYGLWICSKKPVMWSYLKPLHEELSKLEDGVEMKDNKDEIFTMYASLFNCVCDLPAKCMMSNSMQFNGAYGCWYCYQPGTTYKTDKGGHTHIFPYQEGNPKGPERTVESLQSDVNEVIAKIHQNEKNYIVRGVKGPFWFMFLKNFDVIRGFVIDYMHGICGGIMKMLLTFWFDKKFKHQTFSLFNEKNNVNRRLAAIKPNIHITRPPRSLDELCHWKSSEYRNFLFLWGIPVLKGIMPQQYLMHFTLLVRSIYNLSRENISGPELDNAEQCLFKFVELFTSFYPERNLTMNCHQLLHITDSVRANGPLFANNCFIFEDLNGYLLKNIHGTTGVETQVINAITMMQAIPTLQELYVEDSEDSVLINSILRPNYMYQNVCIEEGIYQLGQTFKKILNGEEYCAVSKILPFLDVSVVGYNKVFFVKLSCPVYGSEYGRLLKRNQSIVKFKDFSGVEKYGSVKTFIQNTEVNSCTSHNFALIYPFECISVYAHQQSSHEVTPQYIEISAVPLLKILKVCNIIVSGDITYVSEFPNKHEKD